LFHTWLPPECLKIILEDWNTVNAFCEYLYSDLKFTNSILLQ